MRFCIARIMSSQIFDDASAFDSIIAELRQLCRLRSFERALGIGRLVIAELYDGDLELWQRKQTRLRSFRTLATHAELPLSASDLYRCVATYNLIVRCDARSRWPALTLSHYRCVTGLEFTDQVRLLQNASERSWSAARLAREGRAVRATGPERRGRPAAPTSARLLQHMGRLVQRVMSFDDAAEQLTRLDSDARRELSEALTAVRGFCSRLSPQIEDHVEPHE